MESKSSYFEIIVLVTLSNISDIRCKHFCRFTLVIMYLKAKLVRITYVRSHGGKKA